MTLNISTLPASPVRSILTAESDALNAGRNYVLAVIEQGPIMQAAIEAAGSQSAYAKAVKVSTGTLSGIVALVEFTLTVADAVDDDETTADLLGGILPGMRGYASDLSTVIDAGAAAIARADSPEEAVIAFAGRYETAKRDRAEKKKDQRKSRTVITRDVLTPTAFLSEMLRLAREVTINPDTVSDDDCAEIVALAESLAPELRRIVAAAGGHEAPSLGVLA
jgi:hypothetical protein